MSHSIIVHNNCARCGAKPPAMRLLFRTDTDEAEWVCANGCKPKEVAMFKVGDKVRIKAELFWCVGAGAVHTIGSVEYDNLYFLTGKIGLYYAPELELASATHFPIGTKVRALKTDYYTDPASEGAEGVVAERPYPTPLGRRTVPVRLTATAKGFEKYLDDFSYHYRPEDLDIIALPAKADTSSLKVGDRVRVKRKCAPDIRATAGTVCLVRVPPSGPSELYVLGVRLDDTKVPVELDRLDILEVLLTVNEPRLRGVNANTNSYCEASTKATTPTIKLLYTVRSTELLLNGTVEVTLFHEDADIDAYDEIAITVSKEEAKSIHLGGEYTVTIAKA